MYVCMNNKIPIPEELLVNLTLAKHQRGSVTHLNRSEHNVNCHNDHLVKQSESLQTIPINKQILEKHKILHQIINNGFLLWFIQPWRISKWPHKAACPTWLWWWLHRWWHIIPWGNTIGSIKFLQWQQHAFFWGVWVWYAFSKSWRKWVLFLFVELGNIRFLDWIWIWVLYIWNLQWGYGLMSLLNTKFLVRIERGLNYQIKVFFFFTEELIGIESCHSKASWMSSRKTVRVHLSINSFIVPWFWLIWSNESTY